MGLAAGGGQRVGRRRWGLWTAARQHRSRHHAGSDHAAHVPCTAGNEFSGRAGLPGIRGDRPDRRAGAAYLGAMRRTVLRRYRLAVHRHDQPGGDPVGRGALDSRPRGGDLHAGVPGLAGHRWCGMGRPGHPHRHPYGIVSGLGRGGAVVDRHAALPGAPGRRGRGDPIDQRHAGFLVRGTGTPGRTGRGTDRLPDPAGKPRCVSPRGAGPRQQAQARWRRLLAHLS